MSYIFLTRHPPPVTRCPSPVTRHPPPAEKSCRKKYEQWAKCPLILYAKPSNKRFIIPLQKKNYLTIGFYFLVRVLRDIYPGPRGFSWFFFVKEINSKPRSGDNELQKRRGEREKPLVTLASNLTFMQTTWHDDMGVDCFIVFQTRKPIWLARLIVTTEGTLRIFTPHFSFLY